MEKKELLEGLKLIVDHGGMDKEHDHVVADRLLIEFINDADVSAAYDAVSKWYA